MVTEEERVMDCALDYVGPRICAQVVLHSTWRQISVKSSSGFTVAWLNRMSIPSWQALKSEDVKSARPSEICRVFKGCVCGRTRSKSFNGTRPIG